MSEGSAVERLARLADEKDWDFEVERRVVADTEYPDERWSAMVGWREPEGYGWRNVRALGEAETLESACSKALDRLEGG